MTAIVQRGDDGPDQEQGAIALYRGIHFSTDWPEKRGRTVQEETQRSLEEVKGEGNFSSATWQLAKQLAGPGKEAERRHLDAANATVAQVLERWRSTTDANREDTSSSGNSATNLRRNLTSAMTRLDPGSAEVTRMRGLLDAQGTRFKAAGHAYVNQFAAALSRYIDNQGLFEEELGKGSSGGYPDVPFTSIPFISTTKSAKAAVEYAQGKLAGGTKNSDGEVGRVLIYVAPQDQMAAAGGIDVWQQQGRGVLNFTDWRMSENEVTFSGSIPDDFLRAMTPVHAKTDEEDPTAADTAAAQRAAAQAAEQFGGLTAQPLNTPHRRGGA